VSYYYTERIYLLECIYQIILIDKSRVEGNHVQPIKEFAKKHFADLGTKVWKEYVGLATREMDEKLQGEIPQKEEWILQNAKEQFHLLKILHLFFFDRDDIKSEDFLNMLEHLNSTAFTKSFLRFEK
jgi:hypothetical protein